LSRRPAKEQPPADMRDDKTANTDHTHVPLPSLATSITCPDSDRCDIGGVSVPPLRRSTPAISRFCPVLGWWTMLQLLASRAAESNAFSIRNALWRRAEDDLLVQAVAKHSTSDALFPDWSEVAWELRGCMGVYHLSVVFSHRSFLSSFHGILSQRNAADLASWSYRPVSNRRLPVPSAHEDLTSLHTLAYCA